MELTGISAVVTGAGSGLGAATASALARRGARVYGLDVDVPDLPAQPGALLGNTPAGTLSYLRADVTDETQVKEAVARAAADPGAPLRVAVNCAGIGPSARVVGRTGVHDLALFRRVVDINLVGSFTVLAYAAAAMAQTAADNQGQRGVVINTASIAAFDGQVGQAAYACSKSGIVGLTLPAARDLAQHGVRVMTIAPGIVETPMLATVSEEFRKSLAEGIPFPKRLAQPQEYAQLVLAIIENDYLNGETIRMDGALRMAPR